MGSSQAIGKGLNVWGLTGGIGSGKSKAGEFLSQLGCPIVDADALAKDIRQNHLVAQKQLHTLFGTTEETEIRKKAFTEPHLKKALEAVLHPLIQEASEKIFLDIDQKRSDASLPIIYEASQLIETGRHSELRGLIVVTAPKDVRIERLVKQRGLSKEEIQRIMNHQLPEETRIAKADYIIENPGNLALLKANTESVFRKIVDQPNC